MTQDVAFFCGPEIDEYKTRPLRYATLRFYAAFLVVLPGGFAMPRFLPQWTPSWRGPVGFRPLTLRSLAVLKSDSHSGDPGSTLFRRGGKLFLVLNIF